ncbi:MULTISPECIES: hypothetical protein [Escherichia]|uniref:hypothetical protein n=1 Tax=Escherichia TaxID=561 RepID=UPI00032EC67F|nr:MULTISPECIES: hypothetical protein [Escherichia]EOQ56972.1 hypothetical protein WEW_02103 [Escherichia coli KTE33]EOU83165.1 hypothetical protein WES_01130 [Escherichia sp. KTE31]
MAHIPEAELQHLKAAISQVAYDNDPAVKQASSLAADGIAPFRLVFPAGMDANEYLCKVSEPERAFRVVIDGAVWMGDAGGRGGCEEYCPAGQRGACTPHFISCRGAVIPAAVAPAPGVSVEALADGELMIALPGERWTIRGLSRKTNADAWSEWYDDRAQKRTSGKMS